MILKDTVHQSKKTVTLHLDSKEFNKISHLFRCNVVTESVKWYVPNSSLLHFGVKGYKWSLYAATFKKGEETWYKVFGTCGDSGFGEGFHCKNPGNIRAARIVYGKFIESLDTKRGMITGKKFGL